MRAVHIICMALMVGASVGCSAQAPTMSGPATASLQTDGLVGGILSNGITAQVNYSDVEAGEARDITVEQKNEFEGKKSGITAQVNISDIDAGEARDITVEQKNEIEDDGGKYGNKTYQRRSYGKRY